MDLFDAINKRVSYRGAFKDLVVPKSDLIKIIDAGLKAPSGKNLQTTEFIVIDDEEILKIIKLLFPERTYIKTANALIICLIDKNPDKVLEEHHFQIEDCSAAVENMLLAITALGYATVWLDGVLRRDSLAQKIANILDIPENKKVQIILPIGVPDEELLPKEKKMFEKRAWFNRYK